MRGPGSGPPGVGDELEARVVRADGADLHLLDSGGNGEAVLILHGLAGSSTEFIPTAHALSPDFRVVLLDQRGHGGSTRRPQDVSRRAFVDDVVAVIDALDLGQVRLIGQSMGAHTAILAASEHPELVEQLVILEGHVSGSDDPHEARRLGEFFASWPLPFAGVGQAREFLGPGPLPTAWVADLEAKEDGLWPPFDADVMQSVIEAVHQPRWEEWETLTPLTLAVFGEKGMFSGTQQQELVGRRPRTEHRVIPGASHDAHLDAFERWISLVREFLLR